jgi:hypothetical protein
MTDAERQRRRWQRLQEQRRAQATASTQVNVSEPPNRSLMIEELKRELHQVRRERDAALVGVHLTPAGADEGRCFLCHKRRAEVATMLEAARPYFHLFICGECIEQAAKGIAAKRASPAT